MGNHTIFILYDTPSSMTGDSFIKKGLVDVGRVEEDVYSPPIDNDLKRWIYGAWDVLRRSRRGDTIVCWFDFQGVLCWWLSKLTFRRRNIAIVNIMLKDKATLRNRVVSWLYKKVLTAGNVEASVTSKEYGRWLNGKLGINKGFHLIHDVYHTLYEYNCVNEKENSVFCGGKNGRDWKFMLEVAAEVPDVNFTVVMPSLLRERYRHEIPANVDCVTDIPLDDFMRKMCESKMVCLPLDTDAPAGLIVMFQAAANLKMVITTRTATTNEYISEKRGVALPPVVEIWADAIRKYMVNEDERKKKAVALRRFLIEECSEKKFCENIRHMVNFFFQY